MQNLIVLLGIPLHFVLFHYAHNSDEVILSQVLRPLLLLEAGSLLLFGAMRCAIRNAAGATLAAAIFMGVFLNYDTLLYVYRAAMRHAGLPSSWLSGQTYFYAALCVVAFTATGFVLKGGEKRAKPVLKFASIAVLTLLLLCLPQLGQAALRGKAHTQSEVFLSSGPMPGQRPPDVFCIITDAYARADVLRGHFDFDNTPFLDFLRSKGFYVADRSYSNYAQTYLSLASSLNGMYLNERLQQNGVRGDDRKMLLDLIQRNAFMRLLKEKFDYEILCLESGTAVTELRKADIFMRQTPWALNDFENLLLNQTPVVPLMRLFPTGWAQMQFDGHRGRVLFALEQLGNIPEGPRPKLVFAHIMCPHPPFLLDAEGRAVQPHGKYEGWGMDGIRDRQEYLQGYRGQLATLNRRLQETVEKILSGRKTAPIIVLQGDHGAGFWYDLYRGSDLDEAFYQERFAILNAVLLPPGVHADFYASMSPVNTMRLLVNACFGGAMPRLPDQSYFSPWVHPYDLQDVTGLLAASRSA